MERNELIKNLQEVIRGIYLEEGLLCLRGVDNKYIIKDKQIIVWHSNVTRKSNLKQKGAFNYYENFDDILLCSDEVMYFTAHLFLYRPYVNNPLSDASFFSNRTVYPNIQNLEAKRYYMFCDIVCEKIYNYWDRIGDLIASFFPDLLKPERVFFPTIIDKIPEQFQSLESFIWLKMFKENYYKEVNSKREQVVHYKTSNTDDKHKHLLNSSNREEIKKWVNERHYIADFYKEHINLTIEGLYQTLTFIEEVDKFLFIAEE